LSEALRPALYVLSVLVSAWVLASARRHGGFRPFAVWAWTLSAFIFPAIVLPLYLVARMYTPRADVPLTDSQPKDEDEEEAEESAQTSEESSVSADEREEAATPTLTAKRARFVVPLLYAGALLLVGASSFYQDYRSFDAHLARGARAKLYGRREGVLAEYRAALGVREDAHTRKLLGLELLEAGRAEEALAELRAAEAGGEPDEALAYHVGSALEALGRPGEAVTSYVKFLRSAACARTPPSPPCEAARARVPAP
jgi:tetratricopeptide (TPR) repeat protein